MNTKKTIVTLSILTIIITILGGTLAYWNWQTSNAQKTNVTFTVAQGFTCGADAGGDITNSDVMLAPAACTNEDYAIQREVKVNTEQDNGTLTSLSLWLTVNDIGTYLSQSENFKYALTTNSESCEEDIIAEGTFTGTLPGSQLPLIDEKVYSETTQNDTYYLYIWLDAAETNQNTMNQAFNITVGGICKDELPPAQNYTITLDNANATTNGTSTLYGKYNYGVYLDHNYNNKMTTNSNNIIIPQRTDYVFDGYFDGSTKMIDENGHITNSFTSTKYNNDKTLNARWIADGGIPIIGAKYVSNDNIYTSGTWTKDSVYLDLSVTSENAVITKFQYSLNAGGSWNDLACTKSNGITNVGNVYNCQQVWTTIGNNSITIRTKDSNNTPSTISDSLNLRYDTEAPTASISTNIIGNVVTAILDAEDILSGVDYNHYYFKILTTNTCGLGTEGTTGFVDNEDSNEYTFNAASNTDYYICGKVYDNAGNEGYISKKENISSKVYLKAMEKGTEYRAAKYKDRIQTIQIVDTTNTAGAVNSWNLADDGSGNIKGWLMRNASNTSNYDLYIGSESHIYATDLSNAFAGIASASNINLSGLYTSETQNMSYMFTSTGENATTFNLNLGSSFDTSNTINMLSMFSGAGRNATDFSIKLGNNFNTSKVKDMAYMFDYAGGNANNWYLNLGNNFDAGNVENIYGMFLYAGQNAKNFELHLGNNFNASKANNMAYMFEYAGQNASRFNLNLGNNFNSVIVDNMYYMFSFAGQNATDWNLNLGDNFIASNVKNMVAMFQGTAEQAENANMILNNKFNASNAIKLDYMFQNFGNNAENVNIDLGNNFNASKASNISYMFGWTGSNATNVRINLGNNFNLSNVESLYSMFADVGQNAKDVELLLNDNFNAQNAKNMYQAFYYAGHSAENVNIDFGNNFNAINTNNMVYMFHGVAQYATRLNLNLGPRFYSNNVKNMYYMFYQVGANVTNFSLNLGDGFNTSNVLSTYGMFYDTGSNSQQFELILGNNFTTDSANNISMMFYNMGSSATNFNLNLGNNFNMDKASTSYMFYNVGQKAQTPFTIDVSAGSFNSITSDTGMFNNFGNNMATIYVKDSYAQNWVISRNSKWKANFDANNVVVNNINYILDGGSFASTPLYSMKGRQTSYVLPTPIKQGYTFVGWIGSNGTTPQTTVEIPAGTTAILRYTAIWSGGPSIPTNYAKYVNNNGTYNGEWTNNDLYIELTTISSDTSISSFQYSLDNGLTWDNMACDKSNGITINGNEYTCQTNWIIDGDYNVVFRAIDNNGIATTSTIPITLRYDNTNPTGSIDETITGQSVSVKLTANDTMSGIEEHYYFKLLSDDTCGTGTDGTTGFIDNEDSNEYTFNATENENYYVCAKISDNVDNVSYISKTINISAVAYLKTFTYSDFSPYRYYVRKIEFVNYVNLSNAIESWDVTNDGTAKIKGWVINNTVEDNKYDLYIGSEYKIYATGLKSVFSSMSNVTNINFGELYTDNIYDYSRMLDGTGTNVNTWNVNLGSHFNTSNATNMAGMFANAGANASNWRLNLGDNFNTAKVTDMANMFMGAGGKDKNFSLNLGNDFDTSKVINMANMFYNAGYESININFGDKFNTGTVSNMHQMFANYGSNVTDWNLSLNDASAAVYIKNMNKMFSNAGSNSKSFNLYFNINTSLVNDMSYMFSNAGANAENASIRFGDNVNTSNAIYMAGVFFNFGQNAPDWHLDLGTHFNTYRASNLGDLFYSAGANATDFNLNLGNEFSAKNAIRITHMFDSAGRYATNWSLNLGDDFGGNRANSMYRIFAWVGTNATNWSLDLGNNFNTSNITEMSYFLANSGRNAINFTLKLGNKFNTYRANNMSTMFANVGTNVRNFSLNLGDNFNTSNVKDMTWMFDNIGRNSEEFYLNLGNNFDTKNVTSMAWMFSYAGLHARSFNLILGNKFNMSNVTRVDKLFTEVASNTESPFTIDLSAGNFAKITNIDNIFNYFGNGKATIYVKDSTAQQWLISNSSKWAGTNFDSSNILIK